MLFTFQDPCYEVRDKFSKKVHKALDLLKLPLEYLGMFALVAPEPVKERKNQVYRLVLWFSPFSYPVSTLEIFSFPLQDVDSDLFFPLFIFVPVLR